MVKIQYERNRREIAQELRRNMTAQERHLWYDYLRAYPVQFRRQKQFGRFFADFYCSAAAIVIEVDGAQHYTEQGTAYDQERTWYLESLGLRVIRIPNSYIENRFEETCKRIDSIVQERIRKRQESIQH